jgi:hypothetical protein
MLEKPAAEAQVTKVVNSEGAQHRARLGIGGRQPGWRPAVAPPCAGGAGRLEATPGGARGH